VARKENRNRRLDRAVDRAIADAVVDVLATVGSSGLTMDEVAATAGVGKAALYRRWPNKVMMLAGHVGAALDGALHRPDTGSLRGDLTALLTSLVAHLDGAAGRADRALLSAVHEDPMLRRAFRNGPMARWDEAFRAVLDRAVRRGEICSEAATSPCAEAGPAIILARWFVWGEHLSRDDVPVIVDEVVLPLLCRDGRPQG
jgi:AcrR family transcriptional regulator